MENKKKILVISGIALVLMIAIVGVTYAWFSTTATGTGSVTITSGTLSIEYTQGTKIEASNLKPATKSQVLDAYNQGNCKYNNEDHDEQICYANSFTVTNTGTLAALVTTNLSNITNTYSDNLLYEIFETTPLSLTGNILGTNTSLTGLANSTIIPPTTNNTKTYTILIWLDENAPNEDQGKTYTALINTTGIQTNEQVVQGPVLFKTSGYVYNSNNEIIPNATVVINSDPITTTTDATGY